MSYSMPATGLLEDYKLLEKLAAFANHHILHWMEALSLMGALHEAVVGLPSNRTGAAISASSPTL